MKRTDKMTGNVSGKVVVITGASSGSGEATARHLAALGAKVVIGARRLERIDALAGELNAAGHSVVAVQTDVRDRAQVAHLVNTAVEHFGRLDALLNNAGIMPMGPLEDIKVDEWDQVIDVNLKGLLYGVAAALPHMKAQKSGHILNVSSVWGHLVGHSAAVYCATKFGVRAISEGIRQELKAYNIRSTILSPGAMISELSDHITDDAIRTGNQKYVGEVGITAGDFASIAALAIGQPDHVDINEILFRPTAQVG